jgi:hypothetical protein
LRHATSDGHRRIAAGRKGRLSGQPVLNATSVADDPNSNMVDKQQQDREVVVVVDRQLNAPAALQRSIMTFSDQVSGYPNFKYNINIQVTKAETLWALNVVNSTFSYNSTNNLVALLRAMEPKSEVFKKITMSNAKTSYIISHGLFPYFMNKIVKGIQNSPGYTLGTDAGTFKLHGLSKLVDIVIRLSFLSNLACAPNSAPMSPPPLAL